MAGQGSGGNVLAAICSFFIPGLGQLVQGRIIPAILFFIIISALYGLSPFTLFISTVLGFLIHIWCIINAAKYNPGVL
ncbi:hypothetical protein [Glaciecola sp. 1036]|uniref:hypothetical protein n=1 Tax=Alteromonadaceae TaxID=72275 RepID=UPI003D06A3CB